MENEIEDSVDKSTTQYECPHRTRRRRTNLAVSGITDRGKVVSLGPAIDRQRIGTEGEVTSPRLETTVAGPVVGVPTTHGGG